MLSFASGRGSVLLGRGVFVYAPLPVADVPHEIVGVLDVSDDGISRSRAVYRYGTVVQKSPDEGSGYGRAFYLAKREFPSRRGEQTGLDSESSIGNDDFGKSLPDDVADKIEEREGETSESDPSEVFDNRNPCKRGELVAQDEWRADDENGYRGCFEGRGVDDWMQGDSIKNVLAFDQRVVDKGGQCVSLCFFAERGLLPPLPFPARKHVV